MLYLLIHFIINSLLYILNAMKPTLTNETNENAKLFRINLELYENRLEFSPALDENVKNSFMHMINSLISDIFSVTSHINRIASHTATSTTTDNSYKSTNLFLCT